MKNKLLKCLALAFTCVSLSAFAVACGEVDTGSSLSDISSSETSSAVDSGLTFKTLTVDGLNVYGEVETIEYFFFANEIQTSDNITFEVSEDPLGSAIFGDATVRLEFGDNVYYVLEMNGRQVVNTYTVTIHKKSMPIFTHDDGVITNLTDYGKTLTKIIIPSEIDGVSITAIGAQAFLECTNLISVVIPDSVERIGAQVFSGCSKLTNVVIGDGVRSIGFFAFYKCSKLTSIVIPDSVESIDYFAFSGCNLISVYYKGTASDWGRINIDDLGKKDIIDVTRYYYVENEADLPTDGGNYWRYVSGVPTAW